MPKIADIAAAIEELAPLAFQESYDNSGLQIGDPAAEVESAIVCTDVTEDIVGEAIATGAQMIISHHPLLFKGLKKITGSTPQQRIAIECVKHGIAVYSGHTNVDSAYGGVSYIMARQLGLVDVKVLQPLEDRLAKLVVFVPEAYAGQVNEAVWAAGAGRLGDYDRCSYRLAGEGTFRALSGASPFVGEVGSDHQEAELRLEYIVPRHRLAAVTAAMLKAHPYEEPAFDVIALLNKAGRDGLGCIGRLPVPLPLLHFATVLKECFDCHTVRLSEGTGKPIERVALCGGSGAFLIQNAIAAKADAYVSADFKYHDFTDFGRSIILADIGHYESEQYTKRLFNRILSEKFPNFAVRYAKTETNPIIYI